MHPRRSTELGLLCLAGAFVLAVVGFALPYVWSAVIAATRVGQPLLDSLHALWIPLSGLVLDAGIVVLGVLGFALVWQGRWDLGPDYASSAGVALLALLIAFAAYAAYAVTGGILGFVSGVSFLRPWHVLFDFLGALFLGGALYWMLSHLPVTGSRPAAAVAFALGVAGSALLFVGTLGLRRGEALAVQGAGYGLALASLILWLVLCVWGSERLRERGMLPPPGAAPRGS